MVRFTCPSSVGLSVDRLLLSFVRLFGRMTVRLLFTMQISISNKDEDDNDIKNHSHTAKLCYSKAAFAYALKHCTWMVRARVVRSACNVSIFCVVRAVCGWVWNFVKSCAILFGFQKKKKHSLSNERRDETRRDKRVHLLTHLKTESVFSFFLCAALHFAFFGMLSISYFTIVT